MKLHIVLFYSSEANKLAGVIVTGNKILKLPFDHVTATVTYLDLYAPPTMKKVLVKIGFVEYGSDKYPVPVTLEEKEIAQIDEEYEMELPIVDGEGSIMTLPLVYRGEIELQEGTGLIAKCYKSK